MSETVESVAPSRQMKKWSRWFATKLGMSSQRKEEIYLELSKSAGIATLGLVLSSPAVIIGAMLISQLMGPILAGGLAFAAGDLILGLRAVIDRMAISDASGKVTLALRVFTSRPFTPAERSEYTRLVATRLGKSPDAVEVQLLEIPTAASLLTARVRESERIEAPPTIAQLRASFGQGMQAALSGLRLPPPARMIDYQVATSSAGAMQVDLFYLGDHEIAADAQALIAEDVRARLTDPAAVVICSRIRIDADPMKAED